MNSKFRMCALALAATALAVGCTKDGKFNPSEKISRVYEASNSTYAYYDGESWQTEETNNEPKHLAEVWKWDGKKLASITYKESDGTDEGTVKFEYDGSQLTKAYTDSKNYIVVEYDGKKVASATEYADGSVSTTYKFSHDGSKISKIEITANTSNQLDKGACCTASLTGRAFMTTAMPTDIRPIMKAAAKKGAKASRTTTVNLTWDGKNVGKLEASLNGNKFTTEYSYDSKKNPYQGFLFDLMTGGPAEGLSKNNVTSEKTTYNYNGEADSYTTNYTYKYDGNWPVERTNGISESEESYRYSSSYTTYFEYED